MQKDLATLKPREVEGFTREQIELIKRTVCEGASDLELQLFLYQCNKSGLDPLAKQIYFVKRKGRGTIQTGIDGYRAIADATGQYAGNDDYEYGYTPDERVVSATATVYKIVSGQRCAFTATARWDEYYPGKEQGWAWDKMPHVMLGKCAESLALRKAFPKQLSGMYTTEEMAQANGTEEHRAHVEAERVAVDYGVTAPVGTKAAAEQVAQAKLARGRQPDLVEPLKESLAIQNRIEAIVEQLTAIPPGGLRATELRDEYGKLKKLSASKIDESLERDMAKLKKDHDQKRQGLLSSRQQKALHTVFTKRGWEPKEYYDILNQRWGYAKDETGRVSAATIKDADFEDLLQFFDRDPEASLDPPEPNGAELLGDDVPLN